MKFIHIADVHLGAKPDAGNAYSETRPREIWDSFARVIETCENEKTDILLIAGDLFHRQPLLRELKEVNALFSKLSHTQVILTAGNHDYLRADSYYRTFRWEKNVHMILDGEMTSVEFPELSLAVYGFSYQSREICEALYDDAQAPGKCKIEILLAHGGDERHIPINKKALSALGYDYIALGHIHKPQQLVPGRIAYAGALEPIDKNDTGLHGIIKGRISGERTAINFVPCAKRQYIHTEITVDQNMTGYDLRSAIAGHINISGEHNIYKLILTGLRDPDIQFDLSSMDSTGNIIEIEDHTQPFFDFERLMEQNEGNLLGRYIQSLKGASEGSIEYQALCEGVYALMETRRG